jgi:membrane fusion protein, multidrug efflux system
MIQRNYPALLLTGLMLTLPLIAGCSRDSGADLPGIDEIHKTEGVPVEVREIEPRTFSATLGYTATLSGAVESTASAMLTDEVAEVRANVGEYVEKDQIIISFPADNASLNYEQARVSYESARTGFRRIETLYADEGVSQQSYDNAKTQYEIARANWETVSNVKDVKAPISGYLTRLNVLESDNVEPGDPLFTVSDYRRLKTTVWITDREIGEIKVGQPATANWRGRTLEGRVIQVDMAMDQKKKAFAVKLDFTNAGNTIPSGVTAFVEIEIYSNMDALVADMNEIGESGEVSYVYIADGNMSRRRTIKTGRQQGLEVEILEGIRPGDLLITSNMSLLNDEAKIRIVDGSNPQK